jgi:hypothetical protein
VTAVNTSNLTKMCVCRKGAETLRGRVCNWPLRTSRRSAFKDGQSYQPRAWRSAEYSLRVEPAVRRGHTATTFPRNTGCPEALRGFPPPLKTSADRNLSFPSQQSPAGAPVRRCVQTQATGEESSVFGPVMNPGPS